VVTSPSKGEKTVIEKRIACVPTVETLKERPGTFAVDRQEDWVPGRL